MNSALLLACVAGSLAYGATFFFLSKRKNFRLKSQSQEYRKEVERQEDRNAGLSGTTLSIVDFLSVSSIFSLIIGLGVAVMVFAMATNLIAAIINSPTINTTQSDIVQSSLNESFSALQGLDFFIPITISVVVIGLVLFFIMGLSNFQSNKESGEEKPKSQGERYRKEINRQEDRNA